MEAAGIEPQATKSDHAPSKQVANSEVPQLTEKVTVPITLLVTWPLLPEEIQKAVLRIVQPYSPK